jgi:OmpA-OmpF porin, OOP family
MSSVRILAAAAALAAAFPAARADDAAGYLVAAGRQPVHDAFGDCWHTSEWHPGMHYANCEPKLAAAPAKAAPAPKRVAEAAKPAPKPPAPLRLSADTLFQFDSAALSAKGHAALDALEKRIVRADYRSVEIAGHADPLGEPSYDRALSERRAEAVRDYLVQRGIDAKRIRTKGLGSSLPETPLAQCEGLPRARLIECLQPDRYAEVTVAGTMHTASAQ